MPTIPRLIAAILCCAAFTTPLAAQDQSQPNVFQLPQAQALYVRLMREIQSQFEKKDYTTVEKLTRQALTLAPWDPVTQYNLACALARQGKTDDALAALEKAVDLGFNETDHIAKDPDLESLREQDRFKKAVEASTKAQRKPTPWQTRQIEPAEIANGEVIVAEKNTAWDAQSGLFISVFKLPEKPPGKDVPIINGYGEAGDLLRKWWADGTAAGHHGVLYDNHDGDHSNMNYGAFPQLTRIEFSEEARKMNLQTGLQTRFRFNGIVLGNSSTALTSGPYWRSQPRFAYVNPRHMAILHMQYRTGQIYFYPEHRDHDAGHNGQGDGYGDVYPTNTPYVIISQGSSGSDGPFMNAVAATLAAFQPAVRDTLYKNGNLMPVVQMIFRSTQKAVEKPEDYLTGKAHPTVFDAVNLDMVKMVKAAHALTPDSLPPMVTIKVVEEDRAASGTDYIDVTPAAPTDPAAGDDDAPQRVADREKLFDSDAVIARIYRTTRAARRMVVSAEASRDLNAKPLKYHWVVLRGDASRITIKPLNEAKSQVEIVMPWHERRPIAPGSSMASNRVDIGVFVHNGDHYSAPAFITHYFLDNENRTYDDKGRIKVMDYADEKAGKNYTDPMLDLRKDWRDEYHYAGDKLTGWTRSRGDKKEEFTADGKLIVKKDGDGKVVETKAVRYVAEAKQGQAPVLRQVTETP